MHISACVKLACTFCFSVPGVFDVGTGYHRNCRKSLFQLRKSVLGRLRDLQYMFAVIYETLRAILVPEFHLDWWFYPSNVLILPYLILILCFRLARGRLRFHRPPLGCLAPLNQQRQGHRDHPQGCLLPLSQGHRPPPPSTPRMHKVTLFSYVI